jgi:nucleoside-diphosphate-sugar epimerase
LLGIDPVYTRIAQRQSDQLVFVANTAAAAAAFGWTPEVAKEEGLAQMMEWVRRSSE